MDDKKVYFIIMIPILFFIYKKISKNGKMNGNYTNKTTRGARNKNPFNIIKTNIKWLGKKTGTDNRFETFLNDYYGYRAGVKNAVTQINKGYNTIKKLISRWSPDSGEGNGVGTEAKYVQYICNNTGYKSDQKLDATNNDVLFNVLKTMAFYESTFYDDDLARRVFNDTLK